MNYRQLKQDEFSREAFMAHSDAINNILDETYPDPPATETRRQRFDRMESEDKVRRATFMHRRSFLDRILTACGLAPIGGAR